MLMEQYLKNLSDWNEKEKAEFESRKSIILFQFEQEENRRPLYQATERAIFEQVAALEPLAAGQWKVTFRATPITLEGVTLRHNKAETATIQKLSQSALFKVMLLHKEHGLTRLKPPRWRRFLFKAYQINLE
jgi:hypothetical protein